MAVVCLIGSARFAEQFRDVSDHLTQMGVIVLTKDDRMLERAHEGATIEPDVLELVHLAHLEKIRMADVTIVIDGVQTFDIDTSHDPYVGVSTAREILWAKMHDKPLISLLSASGWGNIADLIDERYDHDLYKDHVWLAVHAVQVLRTDAGVAVVNNMIHTDVQAILHAGMSVLACNGNEASTAFATKTLEIAGLDPVTDMPALMPMFQDPPAIDSTVGGNERLIGRLQMAKTVMDWLKDDAKRRVMQSDLARMIEDLNEKVGI